MPCQLYYNMHTGSFPKDSRHPFEGSHLNAVEIALGFYGIVWAYDGW